MPPINQGSRTALVSWTVVTSFLFVIATIFAIYYYVDANRLNDANTTLNKEYRDVVPEAALTGSPDITMLQDLRTKPENGYNPSSSLLDVAMQRSNNLGKLIAGQAAQSPEKAMADAQQALKAAAAKVKPVGINLQADNLVTATNLLADAVKQRSEAATNARKQADDAVADATKRRADSDAQIKLLTDELDKARGEKEQAEASVASMTQNKDALLQSTAASSDQKLKTTEDSLDKANANIAQLTKQMADRQKELATVQDKLSQIRPDVNRPVLSQPDGHIVRLPGGGVCYIDLGRGDQLIAGMTFEVYDQNEGIPPPGDPNTEIGLPVGKGSIEVTRVGATSSECRIVTTTPGAAMTEGDLIANLIYDKNTKNKFLVYGAFDLGRSGKPTLQDAEVVKKLITQWGGDVVNDVSVDTDFVVLGSEPQVPTLTKEEREDPVQKAIYDKAIADYDAYTAISSKARDYRIPILNQNRFLYLIGYYELSAR